MACHCFVYFSIVRFLKPLSHIVLRSQKESPYEEYESFSDDSDEEAVEEMVKLTKEDKEKMLLGKTKARIRAQLEPEFLTAGVLKRLDACVKDLTSHLTEMERTMEIMAEHKRKKAWMMRQHDSQLVGYQRYNQYR